MTTSGHDGRNTDKPTVTAFVRSLVEAAAGSAITGALVYIESGPDVPVEMAVYVPIIIVVLRTIEGIYDDYRNE